MDEIADTKKPEFHRAFTDNCLKHHFCEALNKDMLFISFVLSSYHRIDGKLFHRFFPFYHQ